MDPFDVYKIYLAVKLHFTTESYDITKHKFATRGKRETFLKRKDLLVLRKMARDYDRKDIIDILVANFGTECLIPRQWKHTTFGKLTNRS